MWVRLKALPMRVAGRRAFGTHSLKLQVTVLLPIKLKSGRENLVHRLAHFWAAGKILDGKNGDVASDQYHKYVGDIDLMSQLHVDAYRFSIAWPRIMKLGHALHLVELIFQLFSWFRRIDVWGFSCRWGGSCGEPRRCGILQ